MTRTFPLLKSTFIALLTSIAFALAFSPAAYAQHSRSGGSGGGQSSGGGATSGGHSSGGGSGQSSGGGGSRSDGRQSSGGRSSGGSVSGSGAADSTGSPHAISRTGSGGTSPGSGSTSSGTRSGGGSDTAGGAADSSGTRSRDGKEAVGRAVERPPYTIRGGGGGSTVIVAGRFGGYYPWAYGGLGFGGYGYYDPWWYDPYGPVYSGGYDYGDDGALRLKVKPREAAVYVDGYYAGRVDDFDGVFQRLKIESGPHRIEVRLDGYETLTFDVRIQPNRTTTYDGELKQLP